MFSQVDKVPIKTKLVDVANENAENVILYSEKASIKTKVWRAVNKSTEFERFSSQIKYINPGKPHPNVWNNKYGKNGVLLIFYKHHTGSPSSGHSDMVFLKLPTVHDTVSFILIPVEENLAIHATCELMRVSLRYAGNPPGRSSTAVLDFQNGKTED